VGETAHVGGGVRENFLYFKHPKVTTTTQYTMSGDENKSANNEAMPAAEPPLIYKQSSLLEEKTGRTLIIGVDDSEMSLFAFNYMCDVVLRKEHDLVVLAHVQPKSILRDVARSMDSSTPVFDRLGSVLHKEDLEILQKYTRMARENGIKHMKQEVILEHDGIGPAMVKLAGQCQEQRPSGSVIMIVGSRELGFFGRAFTGSTSEYCIHNCPCPVIVAKMGLKKKGKDKVEKANDAPAAV
jgi:nucleotide-binding universal stress UspA family protein